MYPHHTLQTWCAAAPQIGTPNVPVCQKQLLGRRMCKVIKLKVWPTSNTTCPSKGMGENIHFSKYGGRMECKTMICTALCGLIFCPEDRGTMFLWTNYMEQSPPREDNSSSDAQEIPHRFTVTFTTAYHLSLFWARKTQSVSSHSTALKSMLILYVHLCLGLQSWLFSSGCSIKTLYALIFYSKHVTCLIHLISLYFFTLTIFSR